MQTLFSAGSKDISARFHPIKPYGLRTQFRFGYGSKHDGDLFDMTICNDCVDTIAETMANLCEVSPIVQFNEDLLYGDDDCDDDDFTDDCDGNSPLYS